MITLNDIWDDIREWARIRLWLIRYRLYKRLHGAERTCDRFGHMLITDSIGEQPAHKAFCRCCHKRFYIEYPANFITGGITLKRTDAFEGRPDLTDEYILTHWR